MVSRSCLALCHKPKRACAEKRGPYPRRDEAPVQVRRQVGLFEHQSTWGGEGRTSAWALDTDKNGTAIDTCPISAAHVTPLPACKSGCCSGRFARTTETRDFRAEVARHRL